MHFNALSPLQNKINKLAQSKYNNRGILITINAHFVYPDPLCEFSFKRPWGTIRKFRMIMLLMKYIVTHEIHSYSS